MGTLVSQNRAQVGVLFLEDPLLKTISAFSRFQYRVLKRKGTPTCVRSCDLGPSQIFSEVARNAQSVDDEVMGFDRGTVQIFFNYYNLRDSLTIQAFI